MTDAGIMNGRTAGVVAGRWVRDGSLWGIVLAGGEGARLRPLVRRVCGDDRPKQYTPLLDSRTLLQQTIDRLSSLIPPDRTLLVTMRSHAGYLAAALGALGHPRVLYQPEDRGTATAILLAAHWIMTRDPTAIVIVAPSDHFILEEALFLGHLGAVARFVRDQPAWMVLLGAPPTDAESEYGWIEVGPRVGWTTEGPVYRSLRFWEKPTRELAATLLVRGCLWNTFVLVAGVGALVAAGRACVPELADCLSRLTAFFGTEYESRAISEAYALAPRLNFSRTVLQNCPGALAVSKLPGLTWCDLGSPARVVKIVTTLGLTPSWLGDLSGV